jgi:hypothetical protein
VTVYPRVIEGSSGTLEIVGEHSAATAALVDITMKGERYRSGGAQQISL